MSREEKQPSRTARTLTDGVVAPPQLLFDDGSRIIAESRQLDSSGAHFSPRGNVPLDEFYELERIVAEILELHPSRIALQFPDELLGDAPDVCWEIESRLLRLCSSESAHFLVFCLGDTTFAPCCPDHIAAAHLQADCLVHFGHACFSPCNEIPVIYSFGKQTFDVASCFAQVIDAMTENSLSKLLILYQVQYYDSVQELQAKFSEFKVVVGKIPKTSMGKNVADCHFCETSPGAPDISHSQALDGNDANKPDFFILGGMEIPPETDWSSYAFLYIGDDGSRQFLNIALRFLSVGECSPKHWWVFNKETSATLTRTVSPTFQRKLNRRFYLVQKAKHCAIFGVLVANLSDQRMRSVVSSLRKLITNHGRTSYTFVVGKINPAKLANFAEIQCFVLVACPEHSLLDDDREFPVPVLTPLELAVAFDVAPWGSVPYSMDSADFLSIGKNGKAQENDEQPQTTESDDSDAPYYSLVTGRYESAPSAKEADINLKAPPGQGTLTMYSSSAAEFLKQREFQGLQVQAGESEVRAAVKGQEGIASNYGGV